MPLALKEVIKQREPRGGLSALAPGGLLRAILVQDKADAFVLCQRQRKETGLLEPFPAEKGGPSVHGLFWAEKTNGSFRVSSACLEEQGTDLCCVAAGSGIGPFTVSCRGKNHHFRRLLLLPVA